MRLGATGSHLKGSKNVPLTEVIGEKGIKSKEEIEKGAVSVSSFDLFHTHD